MRRSACLVLASCLWLAAATPASSEPYAPKVSAPSEVKPGTAEYIGVMMLQSAEVPERAVVPIPPYPGAQLITARGSLKMQVNDSDVECFPYLKLLTTDPPEKVEAFYKTELTGYRFKSEFGGMIRSFWTGADELDARDMAKACTTTNVMITAASKNEILPGARTAIEVTYPPGK